MAEPDSKDLRNVLIILFLVTSLVTSYRCFARYTKKLWWHDDSVALFSTLSFIIYLVGAVYLADDSSTREERIANSYVLNIGFYLPIWGARISIVLTLVRITPWSRQKKILLWVVAFFVFQFTMLTAQTFWMCRMTQSVWESLPDSICVITPDVPNSLAVPVTLVVTTVISDAILITAPLMIIRGIHIRAVRFRLLSIFSMSIATTLASLAHVALLIVKQGVWEAIFAAVGAAVSIIVCNMSVIIPAILRALGVGDPFMQHDNVESGFTTSVEIIRMDSTRIEHTLPRSWDTAVTDGDKSGGASNTATSGRDSADFGAKEDQDNQLTAKISDSSLRKVELLVYESDITDSLTQVRSLPAGQGVKSDVRGRRARGNSV